MKTTKKEVKVCIQQPFLTLAETFSTVLARFVQFVHRHRCFGATRHVGVCRELFQRPWEVPPRNNKPGNIEEKCWQVGPLTRFSHLFCFFCLKHVFWLLIEKVTVLFFFSINSLKPIAHKKSSISAGVYRPNSRLEVQIVILETLKIAQTITWSFEIKPLCGVGFELGASQWNQMNL